MARTMLASAGRHSQVRIVRSGAPGSTGGDARACPASAPRRSAWASPAFCPLTTAGCRAARRARRLATSAGHQQPSRRAEGPVRRDLRPWRTLPRHGGLTVTRGLEADAEQRDQTAHRAIEIREKRRRALSSDPARDRLPPQPPPRRSRRASWPGTGLPFLDQGRPRRLPDWRSSGDRPAQEARLADACQPVNVRRASRVLRAIVRACSAVRRYSSRRSGRLAASSSWMRATSSSLAANASITSRTRLRKALACSIAWLGSGRAVARPRSMRLPPCRCPLAAARAAPGSAGPPPPGGSDAARSEPAAHATG